MTLTATPQTEHQPTRVDFRSFSARVLRLERLGASFVRVTLGGVELADFHFAGLDQRIKLIFPVAGHGLSGFPRTGDGWYADWCALPDEQRCPMRTYTVRAARPAANEFDVDFVVHGDSGPATRWVGRAEVGDELLVIGPDERTLVVGAGPVGGVEFRPGTARRVLLAGDETAVPAICSILEGLPGDSRGQAFLEIATRSDALEVRPPDGVTVTWLPRDQSALGHGHGHALPHGAALELAVRGWVDEMTASGDAAGADDALTEIDVDASILWEVPEADASRELYAWIAGEAGCVKELRRYLVREAGVDRHDVAFMGYWRVGKSEA